MASACSIEAHQFPSLPLFLYFFFPPQEPALQPLGQLLMNLVHHGKSPITAIDLGS